MAKKTLEENIDNELAMKIASLVWNKFIAEPINKGTPPPETFSFNNLKNEIAKIIIEDETDVEFDVNPNLDSDPNSVAFDWIDLNDETFKQIERKDYPSSEEVLGLNNKGGMSIGRIIKYNNEFLIKPYNGGLLSYEIIKFVRVEKLIN